MAMYAEAHTCTRQVRSSRTCCLSCCGEEVQSYHATDVLAQASFLFVSVMASSNITQVRNSSGLDIPPPLFDSEDHDDDIVICHIPVANEPSQAPAAKRANSKKASAPRFRWTADMEGDLVDNIFDHKIQQDFLGKNMEGDLIVFYGEIRRRMELKYPPSLFGPVVTAEVSEGETQNDGEYNRLLSTREADKKAISTGYARIKEKVK